MVTLSNMKNLSTRQVYNQISYNFIQEHYSPKKGEIPGCIELSSYSRINGNLVLKSKLLLREDVKCTC